MNGEVKIGDWKVDTIKVGSKVSGVYFGVAYSGSVIKVHSLFSGDKFLIQLDCPVVVHGIHRNQVCVSRHGKDSSISLV